MRPRPELYSRIGAKMQTAWRHRGLFFLVVFALLVFAGSIPVITAAAPTVSLHMLGEPARSNTASQPILVAGIWHEIPVNLTGPAQASISITFAKPGGQAHDMAADYRWMWNISTGTWSDPYYATFVRDDLSSTDGIHFSFVVGIDANADPGLWTLRVFEGTTELTSLTVEVDAPTLSYALSAADFTFQVEPFQVSDVSSQTGGQYVRAINSGNVPLQASLSFDALQAQLSVVNPTSVSHPGSDARYYLRLNLDPRPPQIIAVNGVSRVTVAALIPSAGSARLVPSVEQSFGVRVFVGRSGYAVKEISGVVFQTLESLHVDYGAIATWQVYLTGNQSVSLSIAAGNANLKGAFTGGHPLSLPATLALSGDSEYPVTIQVEANQAGTATVTFTLHLLTTGEIQTYTTTILVNGGPAPSSSATVTYLWIAGSVGASLVFGFVAFSQWRHRKAGTVSRTLAAQDEAKEKRGYNARRKEQNHRRRDRSNGNGPKGTKSRTKPGDSNGSRTSRSR